ncbi:MAG: alkaline phosphatase family protein [Planctomycetota bacterium]|nr:MAG: alkaline phosphatase family protein [Planctomycetota bacterium]
MKKKGIAIINIVGLVDHHLGPATESLNPLIQEKRKLKTICPAVTCSVQASILTGLLPSQHGIVGNGWYFRELAQVWLWRQSNYLIHGPKFWDIAKEKNPELKVAKLFWWFNMYSTADISVTPRPSYLANGRKIPDIYTRPKDLREKLQSELGPFPLFHFWGPKADIISSEWIAKAAKQVYLEYKPHINLVYLPHLDYNLQRLGPQGDIEKDIQEICKIAGDLVEFYASHDVESIILSEYAILPVSRPVHINRALREEGLLEVHHNYCGELLDPGASLAFGVSDHQICHIYVKKEADIMRVKEVVQNLPGVAEVLDREEQKNWGLNHSRSGELIALAEKDSWFTYYYWLDDQNAPDFARTVDIHQKPGYDPAELFLDPKLSKWKILSKIALKKAGFATVMDFIPLDATLVKGSHGLPTTSPSPMPILLTNFNHNLPDPIAVTDLKDFFLQRISLLTDVP